MLAFGTPEKQILIEPIFAQWIQSAHGKTSYGFDVLLSSTNSPAFNAGRSIWLPGWLNAINENSNSLFLTIGPGDFLVHHAIALGLHTTTLILVKGALDARGSKLMPAVPNGIGNKATLPPTAINSPPPQVKLVLVVVPGAVTLGAKAWVFCTH
ncbi:Photosystem I P700 chlorophyll a apoprotein A2 [Platanthera zijinensis]|uniref:Photosystem I P700 chlorophyll a apoprotein A2 n=1 Tax=Platanthera zijinensis TaxID=2320716 RepID=A0AAP0G293_9ASPA